MRSESVGSLGSEKSGCDLEAVHRRIAAPVRLIFVATARPFLREALAAGGQVTRPSV